VSRWNGLEEFISVAELSSFSKAAARRGASPAYVSREIARLEERLKTQLFYSTTRRVHLTASGEAFLAGCRRLADDTDALISSVMDAGGIAVGLLRMLAPRDYGERVIAPVLGQFLAEHPAVEIDLELVDLPVDIPLESWDLAVMIGPIADSRLIATKIAGCKMLLVASPDYLERNGAPRRIEDLDAHACLPGAAATWLLLRDGELREFKPRARWRCNSTDIRLNAVLEGHGVAYLPDYLVQSHMAAGELISLLPECAPERGMWAVYPHHRLRSPKVSLLLTHLRRAGAAPQMGTDAAAGPR
jgi:DNA-binding transcriptional LysR family regulator